jgi:hypothetical protein
MVGTFARGRPSAPLETGHNEAFASQFLTVPAESPVGSKKRARRQSTPDSASSASELERAADQRRGDAITVAWMLTAVFALAGEIVAILGLASLQFGIALGEDRIVRLVSQMALLVAVVAAAACLAITPLVYRFRDDPPPEAITYGTLLIAAAPFLTALAQWIYA